MIRHLRFLQSRKLCRYPRQSKYAGAALSTGTNDQPRSARRSRLRDIVGLYPDFPNIQALGRKDLCGAIRVPRKNTLPRRPRRRVRLVGERDRRLAPAGPALVRQSSPLNGCRLAAAGASRSHGAAPAERAFDRHGYQRTPQVCPGNAQERRRSVGPHSCHCPHAGPPPARCAVSPSARPPVCDRHAVARRGSSDHDREYWLFKPSRLAAGQRKRVRFPH